MKSFTIALGLACTLLVSGAAAASAGTGTSSLRGGGDNPNFAASRRVFNPFSDKPKHGDKCDETCPQTGQPKVYNGNTFVGTCVCEVCAEKNWQQYNLCRRQCGTGDSGCAQCFPNDATVTVRLPAELGGGVEARAMDRLRVGDVVRTQKGFSRVFAFMDHAAAAEAAYVRIETASGGALRLTADHMVYAHARREPVLAGSVRVGDRVWVAVNNATARADAGAFPFAPSRVVGVSRTLERGMHAPLTEEGSVVVDGVLASSYAKVKSLTWGGEGATLVTGHTLNKHMHAPLRLACAAVPALCAERWHSADGGRHAYTQFLLDHFEWLQIMNHQHSDLRAALVGTEASPASVLAAATQLAAAAALCLCFSEAGLLLVVVGLSVADRRANGSWSHGASRSKGAKAL